MKLFIEEGTKIVKKEQFKGRNDIDEVIFPDSLEEIEERAFQGCQSLKVIQLPKSIKRIGERAFSDVVGQIFYVPKSIEYIGENAFNYSVVYFEGGENSFEHYFASSYSEHPDAFHRGTDGSGYTYYTFYNACSIRYNATHEDFLKLIGLIPFIKTANLSLKKPRLDENEDELLTLLKYLKKKDEFSDERDRAWLINEIWRVENIFMILDSNNKFIGVITNQFNSWSSNGWTAESTAIIINEYEMKKYENEINKLQDEIKLLFFDKNIYKVNFKIKEHI